MLSLRLSLSCLVSFQSDPASPHSAMAAHHQPDFDIGNTNEATTMDNDTGSNMAIPKCWEPDFEREDTHAHLHAYTTTH